MSTVAEIESAIKNLKPQEIYKVGKLDKLMEEAKQDYLAGRCKPFP
jgi:hypothetical protein